MAERISGRPDHNFFFTGKKHHRNPINDKNWNSRIINLFRRLVSVPISPHQLRTIYVTHLYIRASEYEKRGAAQDMHHTTRIQEKIYNRQTHDEITRPIRSRHEAELNRLPERDVNSPRWGRTGRVIAIKSMQLNFETS